MARDFNKSFTQQEPLPEESLEAAMKVLKHGRLHRYNIVDDEYTETAILEREFGSSVGRPYCLAVTSGGYAISCALRALDVKPGDPVLTNAFTLAPVPGAIASLGAKPILVEITEDLVIDIDDMLQKFEETDAKILVLSHMRGHSCDMDELNEICLDRNIFLVEDCAHTMGARWNGNPSGGYGLVSCYSTQTYKHLNSGEGGFLVTDDENIMASATILSGSYMFYDRHIAKPELKYFKKPRLNYPNVSGRMDNLRAAILRPQLKMLESKCEAWNERYRIIENILGTNTLIGLIRRPEEESFVGSSIQFHLKVKSGSKVKKFISNCLERGIELKWLGNKDPQGYTSRYDSWQYITPQECPRTKVILSNLLDMRIPLSFTLSDCELIANIIVEEADKLS